MISAYAYYRVRLPALYRRAALAAPHRIHDMASQPLLYKILMDCPSSEAPLPATVGPRAAVPVIAPLPKS